MRRWVTAALGALLAGFLASHPADAASTYIGPSSATVAGIVLGRSAAAEGNHVVKTTPGNFYWVSVQAGASAGFVLVFDAISDPSDGSVLPYDCFAVAANVAQTRSWSPGPAAHLTTGLTLVFSTTGCFTKTESATAFFSWQVQ